MGSKLNQDQIAEIWSRPNWTPSRERILADLVVSNITDAIFSSNCLDWDHIRDEFNEETHLSFDTEELKTQLCYFRKRYRIVEKLHNCNGAGWNHYRKMIDMPDEWWEEEIEAYPEKEPYRRLGCPIYDQLWSIFTERHGVKLNIGNLRTKTPGSSARPRATDARVGAVRQDNVSLHSGNHLEHNKHQPSTATGSNQGKRKRVGNNDVILEAISKTAPMPRNVVEAAGEESGDPTSLNKCVKLLKEINGVDQNVYLNAMNLFRSPNWRKIFISIESGKRLAWLKAMVPQDMIELDPPEIIELDV